VQGDRDEAVHETTAAAEMRRVRRRQQMRHDAGPATEPTAGTDLRGREFAVFAVPPRRGATTGDGASASPADAGERCVLLPSDGLRDDVDPRDNLRAVAVDLNDEVVRRISEATFVLCGALQFSEDPDVTSRIGSAIEMLDESIGQVRTAMFGAAARDRRREQ